MPVNDGYSQQQFDIDFKVDVLQRLKDLEVQVKKLDEDVNYGNYVTPLTQLIKLYNENDGCVLASIITILGVIGLTLVVVLSFVGVIHK